MYPCRWRNQSGVSQSAGGWFAAYSLQAKTKRRAPGLFCEDPAILADSSLLLRASDPRKILLPPPPARSGVDLIDYAYNWVRQDCRPPRADPRLAESPLLGYLHRLRLFRNLKQPLAAPAMGRYRGLLFALARSCVLLQIPSFLVAADPLPCVRSASRSAAPRDVIANSSPNFAAR